MQHNVSRKFQQEMKVSEVKVLVLFLSAFISMRAVTRKEQKAKSIPKVLQDLFFRSSL